MSWHFEVGAAETALEVGLTEISSPDQLRVVSSNQIGALDHGPADQRRRERAAAESRFQLLMDRPGLIGTSGPGRSAG